MLTLATLRDGDDLSLTRLQDLIALTPGNLNTHLCKLEDAGYVTTEKNSSGVTAHTSVALLRRPGRNPSSQDEELRPRVSRRRRM